LAQHLTTDRQYRQWVTQLKAKIGAAQIKAAVTVNRQLLELYWELGREIYEKQQTANWGETLIDQLASDLSAAFPGVKGFSRANLFFIRKWYLFFRESELVSQLVRLIPWGHNRLIITRCKHVSEALFYVRATIDNNWSRAMLTVQIESQLYKRSGKAINNFDVTLSKPQADLARETLKNPYNFDFLMLGKDAQERDLEHALTDHIQKFIMELGQGFAYMGRQFPINVGGDDFLHRSLVLSYALEMLCNYRVEGYGIQT
jgi:predicted nuclease of restriction endonuclease-like (RecB) superfamily